MTIRKLEYMASGDSKKIEEKIVGIYYPNVPNTINIYNCAPANWKRFEDVKAKDRSIERHFFETVEYVEYKQLLGDQDGNRFKEMIACKVFYCTGQVGWAIDDEGNRYLFGCDHAYRPMTEQEMKERGIRRFDSFDHFSICTKCGCVHGCNSSD